MELFGFCIIGGSIVFGLIKIAKAIDRVSSKIPTDIKVNFSTGTKVERTHTAVEETIIKDHKHKPERAEIIKRGDSIDDFLTQQHG